MGFRDTQNPGIGGLDEITDSEALLVQNLASLSYADGDIIYYNSGQFHKLPKGTNGQILTLSSGLPAWQNDSGSGISDGDKGDITVSASGATWTIDIVTSFSRTLLDDTDATTARATLGLGSLATQSGTFSGTHSGSSSGTNTGDQDLSSYATTSAVTTALSNKLDSSAYDDATAAETNTGTSTAKFVSPDGLAGSYAGTKSVIIQVTSGTGDVSTGDGQAYFTIPESLNGMNLVRAQATVVTAGTTGATTIMVHNLTDGQDMLSGAISIASGGTTGTVGTVNSSFDDVATNDRIRIDVDSASTTKAKGLVVVLEFRLS